ncbi:putative prolyl 4-hydroxylase 7 [Gracilariopsis chorda]|uniref:Putative prolyl 4-hydroxylase 7 n=1 Tax=Gracilariopsis chorda TaxID=448386 RepID=A0A2V3J5R5_9FLOR|nr:putative prolyl 4-hydroxylase 7 [Gracilariopsis chorda]|eukprot:PXF48730.1 putative prolyl 4-hydroxylase 7 [Gracilariopsis chorda]
MHSNFSVISRLIPGAIVNFAWKEPLVVFYDNILTDQEINLIINKATPRFRKSMVAGKNGEPEEDKSRTSDTAWISSSEDKVLASVVQKVVSLTGFSIKNTESIGVNRYRSGQYFNPHYDFLEEQQLSGAPHFRGCQRAGTILIYLSDVEEGGETVFARDGFLDGYFLYDENNPDHLRVKPKRGRVLVWYDMHPYTEAIDLRTLHGGSPVIQGCAQSFKAFFLSGCSITHLESLKHLRSSLNKPLQDFDMLKRLAGMQKTRIARSPSEEDANFSGGQMNPSGDGSTTSPGRTPVRLELLLNQ